MSYWHKDENGKWYFDWSHLMPALVIGVVILIKLLIGD